MSKRAFVTVQRSFAPEAACAFSFLVSEFGAAGPELQGTASPVVAYVGNGVRYRIMLDFDEMTVETSAEIDLDTKRLVAGLEDLVQAAEIGARNHVTHSARTLNSLRLTLETQAKYVRLLQPHLSAENVVELMRAANAREWNVR